MSKLITAITARYGLLGGDKLYQKRARLTLPLLVRQAKASICFKRTGTFMNIFKTFCSPTGKSSFFGKSFYSMER